MRAKLKSSRDQSTAPSHLAAQGRKFYRDMQAEYAIGDGVGLALLLRASECLDRLAQARRSISKHGAIIETNDKLTANPAVKLEREANQTFLSTMRLLNLDNERRRPIGRPARGVGASLETIEAIRNGARRW